jgi:hypothetical protein
MRIRIRQKPTAASIDGLRLDRFEAGHLYDVGTTLGMLLLAEGWADPVVNEEPALLLPLSDTPSGTSVGATGKDPVKDPANLIRVRHQPDTDRLDLAADIDRGKRPR